MRCDCHDLLVEDCARLRGAERVEAAEQAEEQARQRRLLDSHAAFPARYPGQCARCGEWFAAGTPIRRFDSCTYVAACCLLDEDR